MLFFAIIEIKENKVRFRGYRFSRRLRNGKIRL